MKMRPNQFLIWLMCLLLWGIDLANAHNTVRLRMFFGLSKPGGGLVTEDEWQQFEKSQISKSFAGFNVVDSTGYYQGVSEPSKIVTLILDESEMEKAVSLAESFATIFNQESVMMVQIPVEAWRFVDPTPQATPDMATLLAGNGHLKVSSDTDKYDLEAQVSVFNDYVRKCSKDHPTFATLLSDIENSGHEIPVQVGYGLGFLMGAVQKSGIRIDLNDIYVLPDPVKDNSGNFVAIPGVPPWASTVCSTIAHEFAESLDNFNKGFDSTRSHKAGKAIENKIVKETFGIEHGRGDDYTCQHGDHQDFVIELGSHAETYHLSRDVISLSTYLKNGKIERTGPRRLAFITYSEEKFQGASPGTPGQCPE